MITLIVHMCDEVQSDLQYLKDYKCCFYLKTLRTDIRFIV